MKESVIGFDFTNRTEKQITLWLEPWAEEIAVRAGSVVKFKIYAIADGVIETEQDDKFFTVCLWRGCRADILVDGEKWTGTSAHRRAPG